MPSRGIEPLTSSPDGRPWGPSAGGASGATPGMKNIDSRAAQARENARATDGKFDHQAYGRATGVELDAALHRAYVALASAGRDFEAGGFEEYTRSAAQTRRAVADDAASTLYQSALEQLGGQESDGEHDTWGSATTRYSAGPRGVGLLKPSSSTSASSTRHAPKRREPVKAHGKFAGSRVAH